jgi:hypothetical protein
MKWMRLTIQTVSSRASVDVILSLSAHTLCFEWFVQLNYKVMWHALCNQRFLLSRWNEWDWWFKLWAAEHQLMWSCRYRHINCVSNSLFNSTTKWSGMHIVTRDSFCQGVMNETADSNCEQQSIRWCDLVVIDTYIVFRMVCSTTKW